MTILSQFRTILKLSGRHFWFVLVLLGFMLTTHRAEAQLLRVRYVTFNVDFGKTANQIDADLDKLKTEADIIFVQEAKWVVVDDSFGNLFTVYQVTNQGDARAGSALVVRNSIGTVLATGLRLGVAAPAGSGMLDRYMAWADVRLSNGLVVRLISLHMPPARNRELQEPMAENFITLHSQSPYPVIAGADWNYTVNNDPYDIRTATGLVPRGIGIDGFYYDLQVAGFVSITELTALNVNSDHDPVLLVADMVAGNSSVGAWEIY